MSKDKWAYDYDDMGEFTDKELLAASCMVVVGIAFILACLGGIGFAFYQLFFGSY